MGAVEDLEHGKHWQRKGGTTMSMLLWILAVLIGIWGVVTLIRGQVLLGIVLIVVAFLVGPGGVSIFT